MAEKSKKKRPGLGTGLAERAARGMEKRKRRNRQAQCAAQGKEYDRRTGKCK